MYDAEIRCEARSRFCVLLVHVFAHVARIERDARVVRAEGAAGSACASRHRVGWRLHAHAMHAEVDLDVHVDLALRDLRRGRELS